MADILILGKDLLLLERSSEILEVFVFSDGTIQYGKHYGYAIELPEHGDLIDRDALPKDRVEWEDIVNAPVVIPSNKEETE